MWTGAPLYSHGEWELWQDASLGNAQLHASARADVHEDGLHELALDDQSKGRLVGPYPASEWDLNRVHIRTWAFMLSHLSWRCLW